MRSAADGYTLFLPALSSLTYQIVNPDVSFDMRKDFAPVAPLAKGTFVLAVNPELKVKSVAELIALAKEKPGQLLFGSVGNGSLPHLCAEMFAQRAGVKLTHVPYPGSPQVITDLVAGRINLTFNIASSALGQIEAKQLVALAVCSNKRSAVLPDVPTMAEAGVPDFDTSLWLGLLAPAGTPKPVIDTLAAAANKAMHAPAAVELLAKERLRAARRQSGRVRRFHSQRIHPLVRSRARRRIEELARGARAVRKRYGFRISHAKKIQTMIQFN